MENYGCSFVEAKVFGKVNLALNIAGRAKNGYHYIDSIFAKVSCYDSVLVCKRDDDTFNITYKNGENFKNDVVLKACVAIKKEYGTRGADIVIEKGIPLSSGLGGSSASAAGVIRCLEELYNFKATNKFMQTIGSDVPYMHSGGLKRVQGFGEVVTAINNNPPYIAVIIDKNIQINTAKCFEMYDKIGGDSANIDGFLKEYKSPINSLQRASVALDNRIDTLIELCTKSGFKNVVMSGSGGGVVAYDINEDNFNLALNNLRQMVKKQNINHQIITN